MDADTSGTHSIYCVHSCIHGNTHSQFMICFFSFYQKPRKHLLLLPNILFNLSSIITENILTTDLLTLSWFLSMFGLGIHSREFYVSLRCFCTLLHVQAVFVFSLCSVFSVVFLISLIFPFVFSVCHVCSFPSTSVKFTCLCLSLGVRYFPLYFVRPLSCMHMFNFASPASLVRFSLSVFPGVLSDVSV